MNILKKIVENKENTLSQRKVDRPLETLIRENAKSLDSPPIFKKSLIRQESGIIAEIKKASPSAGLIAEAFDPIKKAKEYEEIGAIALSVLTEEDFFMGCDQDLIDVRLNSALPILRKDFIIDEYQIYESKIIGADCILLIASILNDAQLNEFTKLADTLNLDYLIEVHDADELKRIENFDDAIVGINNRNLKTFEVNLENSITLRKRFNKDNIFISESGIQSKADIEYLQRNKISYYLIGESLMRNVFN